ncbi:MAG: hypothetical protein LBP31_03750 [Holosporales bacterium]|nr:hypothetical protein [Holosporales bacterium]
MEIRILVESSASEEFEGVCGAESRSVLKVHEDSSYGSTHKLSEGRR